VSGEGKTDERHKESKTEEERNKKKTQKGNKKEKISTDRRFLHKIDMTSQLEASSYFKPDR
jgi:hypothetical protein